MKAYSLFTALILFSISHAQNCKRTDLSTNYDFTTSITRFKIIGQAMDSCQITVQVIAKITGKKQVITLSSDYIYDVDFNDCKDVRSYSTGINKKKEVHDNDYGNLIIADLNFDGREDFAVKNDSGGNGGPFYSYYLQDAKGTFKLDKFLTESMVFFPDTINNKNKTLVTSVHANTMQLEETTYQLDEKSGKWKAIKSRLVDY